METLLIGIVIFLISKPYQSFAQVNIQDSLALVDYYDSTYGVSPWQFGQSWYLQSPVNTWAGVGIRSSRVVNITLRGGGGGGHLPSTFGNLTGLERIEFLDYQLDAPFLHPFQN